MSVTAAKGFRAAGITAGIKQSGTPDLALLINDGLSRAAAGVFTSNRVTAAPVIWTQQVIKGGAGLRRRAQLRWRQRLHRTATASRTPTPPPRRSPRRWASEGAPAEVAVASTGLIGVLLPMDKLLPGIDAGRRQNSASDGGEKAAIAIKTTDTVHKTATATSHGPGWTVGGMAKGAGMLAPGLATMLVVLTTDAEVEAAGLDAALRAATHTTFDRVDSDGCMSTNDTVLLLASGCPRTPQAGIAHEFAEAVRGVLRRPRPAAHRRRRGRQQGHQGSRSSTPHSETEAVEVGRSIARNNLLKCALHGEDPNWGRVLSAIGTTSAAFDPDRLNVAINGVWVCRGGSVGEDRDLVDMRFREVRHHRRPATAGTPSATVWTNDLTHDYVHENSAYSS